MRRFIHTLMFGLLIGLVCAGCSSTGTSFVRSDVDYSYVQRAAILPFQNLSQDLHAGTRVHSVFTSAVLEQEALGLVDLGETLEAMTRLRLSPEAALTPEQIIALGEELKVDALFLGLVEDYGPERMSNERIYVVTASFSMVETETGSLIWKSQVHRNGTSVWRKLFGGGSSSLFSVSQDAVQEALETLF